MKRFLTFLICLASTVAFGQGMFACWNRFVPPPVDPCDVSPYLVMQNFETPTTGYDHCESWTVTGSTIDPDYTGVVLQGAQSLRKITSAAGAQVTTQDFAGQEEVWVYFLIRPITIDPVNTIPVLTLRNSSANSRCDLIILTDGRLFLSGISSSGSTVSSISAGTTYHIWFHCKNGPAGIVDVGFSTTGIRPTSGNQFAQITGQSAPPGPTPIVRARFFDQSYVNTEEYILDTVRVDNSQIGNNPP